MTENILLADTSQPITPPVRVNQIPRQIPPSTTYLRPLPSMLLVGILPFGAIFVELFFIMNNIWFGKVYYMFGFLFLTYTIMIITCAAVSILLVYFLLCSENYHWQWRSFTAAGASAGYVFANALLYWIRQLSFGSFTSGLLYLGYSMLLSFLFFILTGKSITISGEGIVMADMAMEQVRSDFSPVGHLCSGFTNRLRSTEAGSRCVR